MIGVIMYVFGLMSENQVKAYYGTNVDTPYVVKNVIENEREE